MSVNQRVSDFIKLVKVKEILSKTDLGKTALYRSKGESGGVNATTLESICKAYPKLNSEWLLRGEGKMWLDESHFIENSEKAENELGEPQTPYTREPRYDVREIYIEKVCDLTKGACAFAKLPELEAASIEKDKRIAELEALLAKTKK